MSVLVGVDQKIKRAKEHIDELERAIDKFWRGKPYSVVPKDDPQDPDRVNLCLAERKPLPVPLFAGIIGDAAHNVRASLDYVACGLVEAENGTVTNYTGFPIWRQFRTPTANDLKSLVLGKVQGARPQVVKKLRALEPYQEGNHERLWTVDRLDVVDKHRLLIVAGCAYSSLNIDVGNHLRGIPDSPFRDDEIPDAWISLRPAVQYPIKDGDTLYNAPRDVIAKEKPNFTFHVALGEPEVVKGESVVPTLVQLTQAVEEIIDLFRADLL